MSEDKVTRDTGTHYPTVQGMHWATLNTTNEWQLFFEDCRKLAIELRRKRAEYTGDQPTLSDNQERALNVNP